MILSVSNVSKSFLETPIIKQASFHIEDNEKAAIVGINGAGKTTLLRMIVGELPMDDGIVTLAKGKTFGYLAQTANLSLEKTIYEELLSVKQNLVDLENDIRSLEQEMKHASDDKLEELMKLYAGKTQAFESQDGYVYKSELTKVLKGLGFEPQDFDKSISTLSGGQKTRVLLAKLLLEKPDLIILDEPTNHLDISSIRWLEGYLMNYKGSVLLVSHDRYFLDRIVTKVIAIENAKVSTFSGNYTDFAKKAAQIRKMQLNAYLKQQEEIKHQQQVIDKLKSFNREKSIKRAESREKMLDKIEILDKPVEIQDEMSLKLTPNIISGNDVLTITNLAKSFDTLKLFDEVNVELKRGEHVAIIGDNGTGKTTLLKILNGLLDFEKGEITLGTNVEIGYYDQEHHVLHDEKTIFEEIQDTYPTLNNTQIRNTLAAFLFTGEDVFKKISSLSGGEKGRVSLAKLMLSNANFLILDEPTNHLDITSKEILEQALNSYEGTVLYVSHDRYFVNQTASRILELVNQRFYSFNGNYEYYLEKRENILNPSVGLPKNNQETTEASSSVSDSENKQSWQEQKAQQANKRKIEARIKKIEEEIETIENKLSSLDEELAKPEIATNSVKLQEITKEQTTLNERLEALYEEWESISE